MARERRRDSCGVLVSGSVQDRPVTVDGAGFCRFTIRKLPFAAAGISAEVDDAARRRVEWELAGIACQMIFTALMPQEIRVV